MDSKTCLDATDALYSNSDSDIALADLGSPFDEDDSPGNDRQALGMRFDHGIATL